jgi:hypothetical protein
MSTRDISPNAGSPNCKLITSIDSDSIVSNLQFKILSKIKKNDDWSDCNHADQYTVKKYVGLCGNTVTFNDICCFADGSNVIVGIPLDFSVELCNLYVLKPTLEEKICIKMLDANGGFLNTLRTKLSVANGYLYITIDLNLEENNVQCTIDEETKTVTRSFTLYFDNFYIPVEKVLMYCHKTTCKPITWDYGYPCKKNSQYDACNACDTTTTTDSILPV